nr:ent-kaurene oxidase, chloroplastic-like [Tanacetum cinerariifolium]
MDVQTVGSAAIVLGGPVVAAAVITPLFLKSFLSNQCRNSNHSLQFLVKEKKPFKTVTKWAETYGPIYSTKTGATSMVVVNSSHLAKEAIGKDVESIHVRDLGATMTKEIFKFLVTDPTMGAIEVDWRDFLPYLKWIPSTSFDKKIEQMYIRREAVMNVLIQHLIKRRDSGEVAINIYGCNMDRETWENHEDWNPERFFKENVPIDLLRIMSFGAGKRVCAGATQVMLIASMGIGRMCWDLTIYLTNLATSTQRNGSSFSV